MKQSSGSRWYRCKKPSEWFCDVCRTCGDHTCKNCAGSVRPKWMKHLGDEIALCEHCWPKHHKAFEKKYDEQRLALP
jgi:hypothetical protein